MDVDQFERPRPALAAYRVHDDYGIFHLKAGAFPAELACFGDFDHDVYSKLRSGTEPVIIGQPQRLAGDPVSLGGQYQEKSH